MKALLATLILLLSACSQEPEPELVTDDEIVEAEERIAPQLVVQQPSRGLFTGAVSVAVSGAVQEGSAPITSVAVNGQPATLDGGFFTYEHTLSHGPNLIGVRAEAQDRGRAVDAITVFAGDVHLPGARLENAVHVHLGKEFLDDNDPDLDDISSVIALIVADEQFLTSLTSEPFAVGDDTITVTRIEVQSADVDLVPETNCIAARIAILQSELDLQATGIAAILGDEVFVTADSVAVELLVCGTETVGQFEVVQTNVTFDNLILATSDVPDLATELPSTHANLVSVLDVAISNWLGNSFGGFLTQLLDIFALEYTFAGLRFGYELTELSAHPDGLELRLSGSVSSDFGLPQMWAGAGSLRTDDPVLPDTFSSAPVALAMSDDALNQLLFAYWWSGAIADFDVDPAALSELPEVFQPLSDFDVQLGLPPALLPAEQPEFAFDFAAGEIGLTLQAGTDRTFKSGLHVRTGVNLAIGEDGGIGLAFDGRAQKITVHANVTESPASHEKGDVAALLRLIVPSVLGAVDVNYGGFPLPDFELSAFSENVAAFMNRTVTFVPAGTSRAGEGGGFLVVEGALSER